jgi:PAS domain S-box-containing protein
MMQTKANILIVEDDVDLGDVLSMSLQKEGYYTRVAGNAEQCLKVINNFLPDFLIVDYGLPDKTGAELISLVSDKMHARMPGILVVSGFRSDDEFIDGIIEKGAIDFIRKPFQTKELLRRVNAYFKIRNLENKRLSLLKEYHAVLDLSGEIVFHIDKDLKFTHLNNAFETLTKHKVKNWLGKSPRKVIHESDWAVFEESFKGVAAGDEVQMFEVRITRADGSKFPLSLRMALLINESGEKSVVGVGHDLSNLKWLKEESSDKGQEEKSITENDAYDLDPQVRKREINQNILAELQVSYSQIVGKSVENRIYKLDQNISSELSSLGNLLGRNFATPRDIINLHTGFLKKFFDSNSSRKTEVISEESRIVLLKLMGNLVLYYRNECVKNNK